MPQRPGVEAAIRLSKLVTQPSIWTEIESKYSSMLVKKKGDNEELLKLDEKCEEIGRKLRSMESGTEKGKKDDGNNDDDGSRIYGDGDIYEEGEESDKSKEGEDKENFHQNTISGISCEELFQIMKWKFSKGKSRPLWKYLNSNSEESVQKHSKASFLIASQPVDCVNNSSNKNNDNDNCSGSSGTISEAIKEMCKLSGVGPASSSAILSLFRPDLFVFMDDEVIECLHSGKREYSLKVYLEVNQKCQTIASQLGEGWDVRRVGRALWTAATIKAYSEEEDLTLHELDSYRSEASAEGSCNDPKTKNSTHDVHVGGRRRSKRHRTS